MNSGRLLPSRQGEDFLAGEQWQKGNIGGSCGAAQILILPL
jgi:hypothetical protein